MRIRCAKCRQFFEFNESSALKNTLFYKGEKMPLCTNCVDTLTKMVDLIYKEFDEKRNNIVRVFMGDQQ